MSAQVPKTQMHRSRTLALGIMIVLPHAFNAGFIALTADARFQTARAEAVPDLPLLNLNNFLPVIRQQIEQAYTAARMNPENADVSGRLGMILDAYEQYESAAICYRRAHLLDPGSFRWLFDLGWVQAAQGKHDDAVRSLKAALRVQPDDVPARLKLAESLIRLGEWQEARVIYQTISETHRDSAEAYYGLGRISAAAGDLTAAAAAYQNACDLFPEYGAAHYALALIDRKLGHETESQRHFSIYEQNKTAVPPLNDPLRSDVVRLNVGSVAHIRRGADLEQAGKLAEAIAEQNEALRVDPGAVQAHIKLIALYGRLDQYDHAIEHYRAALDLDPNQADAHYNYGVLLLKHNASQDAETAFRRALQINPDYAEAHFNLGSIYEQQGRLDDALQQFTAAVERRPDYAAAHFHIGRILANQARYEEAIQHFLKTLTVEDENTPRYLYALSATYARADHLPEALKYARAARDQAAARGQNQLLASIDKDLQALEQAAARIRNR
jgi:tetratricopeptide (TPR) repeat protein